MTTSERLQQLTKEVEKIQADITGRKKYGKSWDDDSFCREHGMYFVECGHLGHGEQYDPKETI